MRLFLQLDINDWQKRSYDQPMTRFASSLAADIVSVDVDNHSDPHVVELLLRLVNEAENILVLIRAEPDAALGVGSKLMNHLLRAPHKVERIILLGHNQILEKTLTPFQDRITRQDNVLAAQAEIKAFAEKSN